MTFSERVKATGLPLDEVVVIGSGLLDQLGARTASDVDLVVSERLFDELSRDDSYVRRTEHGEEVLEQPPLEVWRSWGSDGVPNFEQLYADGQTIDHVRYVAIKTLLEQKRARNLPKDQTDIAWLEQYVKEQNND